MALDRLVRRTLHVGRLVTRPMTLGVRGAVFNTKGRIFLVRHTYVSGWYLPGGGVEPGETALEALARECREEGNLELGDDARLVGFYFDRRGSLRDHVALYRCTSRRQTKPKTPDREIAEAGFFDLERLPSETSDATRRRIAEISGEAEIDTIW